MKLIKTLATLLVLLCGATSLSAQSLTVTGTVRDVSGYPLPGAAVMVTGTGNGAVTDLDGRYELRNVAEAASLTVDILGYKGQTVKVGGRAVIDFVLEEDSVLLEETVVVGYGQVKKSDLTGSVASVKAEKITDIPANSVDALLQGRVAGVQVTNASQDPGASSTVRIRGNSSLNGSNSPLVVIDGFPYGEAGAISQINPQDIISMEVLKDASASAIYGSRGANGVILITTRKAQGTKNRISVRQQTTLSQFTQPLHLWRDPVLMAMLSNESRANSGLTQLYVGAVNANGIYYPSIEELQSGEWSTNTRWDDIVFNKAPISDNTTVKIQSSNDKTMFTASANYYRDNGMYIEDTYTKYGANFAVDHKIFENLRMKASANVTQNKRHNNGYLSYNRNPIFPVYDDEGNFWQYSVQDYYHPLALTKFRKQDKSGLDLITYMALDYRPWEWLDITAQVNYKHGETISDYYYPKKYTERGVFNNGYGAIQNWRDDNLVVESYATFDKEFGIHHLTAMAGYSYESYESRSSDLAAVGFVNESLGNENLASGDPEKYQIQNSLYATKLISGLFRFNYTLAGKYLATFTARADGSSKFGADNKWAFFPSGALSWKMSEEDWLKDISWVNLMKLRASYGISGNQGISAYQTLSRYGQHKYFYEGSWTTAIGPGYKSGTTGDGGIYAIWSGIPNTGLKWETTSQLDLGFDGNFFNERLNVTFDWYYKHTSDLLRQRNIAPSSGYDKMWVNDGEILNRGIEITLDGIFYRDRDWNVGGTLIFSKNRNSVLSLGNSVEAGLNKDVRTGMEYEFYGNSSEQYRGFTNILAVGYPMYVFYGYVTDGIIQSLAEGLGAGLSGDDAQPGEFKYVDIYNGDRLDIINEDDRCIIGDPNPDFLASLSLNASWKNLDFSVFFNGVFGNDVINSKRFDQPNNMPFRWTPDNPTNLYPKLSDTRQTRFSSWWIEDGSFVRIQTMTLGYKIPLSKKDMGRVLRLYISADNLYTFTKFSGYDPEVSALGLYSGGYPRLRKWTFGLDFNF